ncbi:MAG: hypothetical protein P4M09_31220 [Devosia sp.]|nr:hypothetical protein [Devosia sp.]
MKAIAQITGWLAAIGIVASAGAAAAASPAYLDDRSTAASLVKSFYNAVNRHEYARAYTYFGANPPQPYQPFADGYADTASVTVVTGAATSDGAAGSTYFTLPVAIDAVQSNGTHRQFAGCYTTRLIQPGVQDPPVTPMFIYKANLHAAHGPIGSLLPHCQPN